MNGHENSPTDYSVNKTRGAYGADVHKTDHNYDRVD